MAGQSIHFLTESAVRLEFHITVSPDGLRMETLHNPPREPDAMTFATAGELADAMAARVKFHLDEHRARLRLIRLRHDPEPIGYEHLARYGVPLMPVDDGASG